MDLPFPFICVVAPFENALFEAWGILFGPEAVLFGPGYGTIGVLCQWAGINSLLLGLSCVLLGSLCVPCSCCLLCSVSFAKFTGRVPLLSITPVKPCCC